MDKKTIVYPSPSLWTRIIEAIKEALAQVNQGPSRAERRAKARVLGAKRTDGKFRGNPSLQSAVKEYKLQREVHRG